MIYFVPTATVLITSPQRSFEVLALRARGDRGGKLSLPHAPLKPNPESPVPGQAESFLDCALGAAKEQLSLGLSNVRQLTIRTDPVADVRTGQLGDVASGACDAALKHTPISAAFGVPDIVFTAECAGSPCINGDDTAQLEWIDARTVMVSKSAAASDWELGHDLVVAWYAMSKMGVWFPLSSCFTDSMTDFADVAKLRQRLIDHQQRATVREGKTRMPFLAWAAGNAGS